MKNLIFVLLALVIFSSCTKDFEEINTDPNRITNASNGALMVYAQRSAAYTFLTGGGPTTWCQYTASQDAANTFLTFDPGGLYGSLYHDILYQLDQVILSFDEASGEDENSGRDYIVISKAMQIWTMAIGLELWGDMPYFDALQGGTYEGGVNEALIKPKFDSQEDVYKYLIEELDKLNDYITESAGLTGIIKPGSYDIYAGGNMTMWQKFINSLQAKMALRISGADQAYALAELNRLFSDPDTYPMFENVGENMGIRWQGLGAESQNISGMAYSLYNNGDYEGNAGILNTGVIRLLAERKDPRRFSLLKRPATLDKSVFEPQENDTLKIGNYYYHTDSLNVMTGFPPARTETTESRALRSSIKLYSSIGGGFANVNRKDFVMDYPELCFIKAEAKMLGVDALTEDVSVYYEEGVRASMEYFKSIFVMVMEEEMLMEKTTFGVNPKEVYSEDSITAYMAQTDVMLSGDEDSDLEKIITQRYLSNFNNGYNAFSFIRRTGYPKLDFFAIGVNASLGFPTRYEYPESVAVSNGNNLIDAIGKLSNNIFDGKVWMFANGPDPEPAFDDPIENFMIYDVFSCELIYSGPVE